MLKDRGASRKEGQDSTSRAWPESFRAVMKNTHRRAFGEAHDTCALANYILFHMHMQDVGTASCT